MSQLAFSSATELLAKLARREVTSRELVDLFIERIERLDGRTNCVVVKDFDRARERADAADVARHEGAQWGPLHGLPVTLKESFACEGLPTTRGSKALSGNVAERNMLAVERLVAAGAIVLGKTNVPLMLADYQTFNSLYGTTSNPWDLSRTPGGSSGGSAAAVAAGFSAADVGSDVAGSLRNPAHYCGVYAHKPTHGICPTTGHELGGRIAPRDITVIGPLARSALDLDLLLDVLAGPDAVDAQGWMLKLPAASQDSLASFRVAVVFDDPQAPVDQATRGQLRQLMGHLSDCGATVAEVALPVNSMEAYSTFLALLRGAGAARLSAEQFDARSREARELPEGDGSYAASVLRADVQSHRDWLLANESRHRMRSAWSEFFRNWDVLLCPAAMTAATGHDQTGDLARQTISVDGRQQPASGLMFWAGLAGAPLLPVTSAPIGLTQEGLPIGVQIIGAPFQDRKTIRFAQCLERQYWSFHAPPLFA